MKKIRVLVGTRKGAFILTSDNARRTWSVSGPHFAGWEIYHVKGSPVDPDRIYASQTSSWFGQIIQRSDDGGENWYQPGSMDEPDDGSDHSGMPKGESNKFVYDTSEATGKPLTTHQFYDGTQHPWEFARVWHLEPSLDDPDTVYAGVEDAALFKTTDGGRTWKELAGLRGHESGPRWQPGAGGMCLHTIVLDPTNPDRIYTAISAAGSFRSDDGGDSWFKVSGNLPSDFGFPIAVHAHEPETIYVVPILSDALHYPPEGRLRVYRSRSGGNEWEALTRGLPQENCYVNVLRDAMAVDTMERSAIWKVRVTLPHHLCVLASVDSEVVLAVKPPVSQKAILDALEARYPMLCGTLRDHATRKRRARVRFFANEEDLTHDAPDKPLPDVISSGEKLFMIIGAISGG